MMTNDTIVYVAPSFESIQHEVTRFSDDDKKTPLETSLHSDVSLMMRIDKLAMSAKQIETLKQQLQPVIDSSNLRAQFEDAFGTLTDEELIRTCPSRYIQSASEQKDYLKTLAEEHSSEQKKLAENAKEKEERDKIEKEREEGR